MAPLLLNLWLARAGCWLATSLSAVQRVCAPQQALEALSVGDQQPSGDNSGCYVAVTLRMLGRGHARTGAVLLAQAAARSAAETHGMSEGPSNLRSCPFADVVCQHCYPGGSGQEQPMPAALVENPAEAEQLQASSSAQPAVPDGKEAAPSEPRAGADCSCADVQPGCVLGFVTCGWQEGMPASCPAQAVLRLQGLLASSSSDATDGLPSLRVWVWDYRSGLLHPAAARAMVL